MSTAQANTQSQHVPFNPSASSKRPCGNNRGLQQAYDFRDFAANEAKALALTTGMDPAAKASALRALASVWVEASERIRIIRGKGLPKAVEAKNARRKRRNGWSSGTPPPPPSSPASDSTRGDSTPSAPSVV